ncbi:hypothetical protein [Mycobacterium haemophilum]|nr:hypothetical protein [Mycobacterium haemophilum]
MSAIKKLTAYSAARSRADTGAVDVVTEGMVAVSEIGGTAEPG